MTPKERTEALVAQLQKLTLRNRPIGGLLYRQIGESAVLNYFVDVPGYLRYLK
jgi:hypothetical protein